MTRLHKIERLLIGLGGACCTVLVILWLYRLSASELGRVSFEAAHPARLGQKSPASSTKPSPGAGNIDFTLWSEKRIRAFQASLAKRFDPPLAILQIPRIRLEVPIFNGTDESVLNRGVGRIIGTARLGEKGNLGIAGHRDGFFRALKELETGDEVMLVAADSKFLYQVDNITIVAPDDVGILQDRAIPALTLVTCYPFYFIGDAPQRYVVQCSLKQNAPID